MPNAYSNFTGPDQDSPSDGRNRNPGDPDDPARGTGDNGEVWNSSTQRWEMPPPSPAPAAPSYQFKQGEWGGQGNDIDYQGQEIAGTSGATRDVNRYRDIAGHPLYTSGPQIDQFDSDNSRGLQMNALGMLQSRAQGGMTPAQALASRQTQGAVAGVQSTAASIKGGAMARAAAARGAQNTGSRVFAQGQQDQAALQAREMADASGQYFGAAQGQRAQDLGVAASQAQLDAQQRAAADQREGFYEDQAQNTKNAELSHKLGRNEADASAANAAKAQSIAESKAAADRANTAVSAGIGGFKGGVQAYDNATKTGEPDPNDTTSDPQAKRAIRPVSDAEAARLKKQAKDMQSNTEAQRFGLGLSVVNTPGNESAARGEVENTPPSVARPKMRDQGNPYDDYDRGMFGLGQGARDHNALHAGIEAQLEKDKPAGNIIRKDPYAPQSLFGGRMGETADLGYARSRKGKPGYMFGGAPEASYGNLHRDSLEDDLRGHERQGRAAPGTTDFVIGTASKDVPMDKFSREIAMSDSRTKEPSGLMLSPAGAKQNILPLSGYEDTQVHPLGVESRDGGDTTLEWDGGMKGRGHSRDVVLGETMPAASGGASLSGPAPKFSKAPSTPAATKAKARGPATRKMTDDEARRLIEQTRDANGVQNGALFGAGPATRDPHAEPEWLERYMMSDVRTKDGCRPLTAAEKAEDEAKIKAFDPNPQNDYKNQTYEQASKLIDEKRAQEQQLQAEGQKRKEAEAAQYMANQDAELVRRNNEDKWLPGFIRDWSNKGIEERAKRRTPAQNIEMAVSRDKRDVEREKTRHSQDDLVPASMQGALTAAKPARQMQSFVRGDADSLSDPKSKQDVHHFGGPMADANRSMDPSSYEYKPEFLPPEQEPGEKNVGPMADKMERDPVASTAIVKDPQTGLLAIDKTKGLKLVMGGLASLQRQVDQMGGRR